MLSQPDKVGVKQITHICVSVCVYMIGVLQMTLNIFVPKL